jgi:hypothetical protein
MTMTLAVYESEERMMRVFDCEPAGLLVIAKSTDGKDVSISPSKRELYEANITKDPEGYERLVRSLELQTTQEGRLALYSSLPGIRASRDAPTAFSAEEYLKNVVVGKSETLAQVLSDALTELCRQKPRGEDAVEWLGHWLIAHNPSKPTVQL